MKDLFKWSHRKSIWEVYIPGKEGHLILKEFNKLAGLFLIYRQDTELFILSFIHLVFTEHTAKKFSAGDKIVNKKF